MPYEFSIEVKETHIRLAVTGTRGSPDSSSQIANIASKIAASSEKSKTYYILVILDVKGNANTFYHYNAAANLKDFGWVGNYRLAVVNLDSESHDSVMFMETVARNRGFIAKVFDNEADAVAWLEKSRPAEYDDQAPTP